MTQQLHGGCLDIEFGGEQLTLLPERALWWPAEHALFVADLHFGKCATFRAAGIPIPNTLHSDLSRLSSVVEQMQAKQLIVLGDLLHARDGRAREVIDAVAEWRRQFPELRTSLVRGNHDRYAGDPPAGWQIECLNAPVSLGPLTLLHYPNYLNDSPTLAGHIHPKHRMRCGHDDLRLPCFLRRASTLVLPAFSGFVDHDIIRPQPEDSIYVVANSNVIAV